MNDVTLHALLASGVALFVGLACAALLDWASRHKKDATVHAIFHRCIESVIGGAIEGSVVTLLVIAVKGSGH